LGIALGGVCIVAVLVRGAEIPPEGNLVDTATFNGALGIFVLTLAALAPGVHWTRRGRRKWAGLLVGFMLYAYGIETLQAFRGLDPRFSRVAGPLDQAAAGVFFLVALSIMSCFTVLILKYFRAPSDPRTVAVRYGAVASYIAFAVGIVMSVVTQGRHVPEAGNLLVLHAAGFHGLQAIPLVALLQRWARTPDLLARRTVHPAGLAWLGACIAIAWQSGSGRAIGELTWATGGAALCLLVFGLAAARAVGAFWNAQVPVADESVASVT
jgi:hypothetical protein